MKPCAEIKGEAKFLHFIVEEIKTLDPCPKTDTKKADLEPQGEL